MTAVASNIPSVAVTNHADLPVEQSWFPARPDRVCLILSSNRTLIRRVTKAAAKRSFQVHDYTDVEEAAVAALFSPPALAVLDLAMVYDQSQFRPFVALCRQLATEQTTQLALIGYADDEREEKLFRQLGATYYFPELPSLEDLKQLAIGAASRIRAWQQDATTELLRRAARQPAFHHNPFAA